MNKNKDEIKIINIIIKAFIIALIIFLAFIFIVPQSYIASFMSIGYFDEDAKDISDLDLEQEKLLEELQKYADASNFSIEMNAKMVFQNGREAGTMYIANPESNSLNMIVDIYLDDTNELIYKSGVLKPGDYIEKDSLRVFLEEGVYSATASISAVAPNTSDVVGEIELDLLIYILE